MPSLSTLMRNVIANAIGNSGAGINFDSGVLELRTGAAPGPNAADSGTLVASMTLPADAYGAAATGVISKSGTWQDLSADATGVVGHYRFKQAGDTGGASGATDERIEGPVSEAGGGGEIIMDNNDVNAGQAITVNSWSITVPAS